MATLEGLFSSFGKGKDLDSRTFVKICRDTKILGGGLTPTDCDLIFTKCKAKVCVFIWIYISFVPLSLSLSFREWPSLSFSLGPFFYVSFSICKSSLFALPYKTTTIRSNPPLPQPFYALHFRLICGGPSLPGSHPSQMHGGGVVSNGMRTGWGCCYCIVWGVITGSCPFDLLGIQDGDGPCGSKKESAFR